MDEQVSVRLQSTLRECLPDGSKRQPRNLPPHAPELEANVLGALMLSTDPYDWQRPVLHVADFYVPAHRRVYQAMLQLATHDLAVDAPAVVAELTRTNGLGAVGGAAFVESLLDGRLQMGSLEQRVKQLRDFRLRRQVIAAAESAAEDALAGENLAAVTNRLRASAESVERASMSSSVNDAIQGAVLDSVALERAELPRMDPVLGDHTLCRGDYGILYGAKGLGKSWAALQLAVAVAGGEPWFGIPTWKGRVLVMSFELVRERLRERMRTITGAWPVPGIWFYGRDSLRDVPAARQIPAIPRLSCADDQLRVVELVRRIGPQLVIVDPLGLAIAEDENRELLPISLFLIDLSVRTDCAVLIVHHPRKLPPGDRKPAEQLSELRGAGQLADRAAVVMMLGQSRGALRLKFTGSPRHGKEPPETWLERTDAGPFRVIGEPLTAAAACDEKSALLRDALQERGSMSVQDVCATLGVKIGTARNYLRGIGARTEGRGPSTRWFLESHNAESLRDRCAIGDNR